MHDRCDRARLAIGTVLWLALAGAAGCGGDGSSSPDDPGPFGGTPPTEAELATYPKALPPDALASRAGAAATVAATPTRYEIADERLPPVQAQGTPEKSGYPGSCEVWSAGYAMGSYTANLTNRVNIKDLKNTVSTAFVYVKVLNEEKKTCGQGTSPAGTLNYLVHNTAPSLATIAYEPVCECPPGSDQCLDAIDIDESCATDPTFCTDLSIGSWAALAAAPPSDILATIKGYVAEGRIVQITIVVPYEFGDYDGGVYDAPASCPSPQASNCAQYGQVACIASTMEKSGCAQHGVAIVGYDDEKTDPSGTPGALKIMNSFGTSWGESGFMWMSYATFEAIYLGATTAEPPSSEASSSALGGASGAADSAFQWVEERPGAAPKVHLIFASALAEPLLLGEIAVTPPGDETLRHTYGHAFRSGYHYVTRHDGRQFEAGTYAVRVEGTRPNGENVVVTSEVEVELADGSALPAAPPGDDVTGTNGQPVD
jgi:hypothetical protein